MRLILCRHGNTFEKGDRVFFAGSREDLPLVERGRQQAVEAGEALARAGIKPAQVFCGPLKRTKETASIISGRTGLPSDLIIDTRLNELDYGDWAGLSSDEISTRWGKDVLDSWNRNSIWPENCNWSGSERDIIAEVQSFALDVCARFKGAEAAIAVSSNGRLRYFLTLIEGEFERRARAGTFKVGTGNICCLEEIQSKWQVLFWDMPPEKMNS